MICILTSMVLAFIAALMVDQYEKKHKLLWTKEQQLWIYGSLGLSIGILTNLVFHCMGWN